MAVTDYFIRKPVFDVFAMRPVDVGPVSALHHARFPRGWSEDELHGLLSQETVFGFVARQTNAILHDMTGGFVLARAVAGEAEILSIATDPRVERTGLGWRLMLAAMREARARNAEEIFLEVDETNAGAIAFYGRLRFETAGRRRAYYAGAGGARTAALVMRHDLR
ncbi:GNAT family N-acetyltransferase [Ensifer soli]|uniref:GNAT family N-acetyltransferase n=1 Tax=Ciceribacter sp. sgz301302 TaxID=3342379 RepID=UPI0035B84F4C